MDKEKLEITKENVKELGFYNTTKDLYLEDGSLIRKGTEFLVETNHDNNKYEVHFSANERNYYKNEFGDNYMFSLEDIKGFAEPSKYAADKYEIDKIIKGSYIEKEDVTKYLDDKKVQAELRNNPEFISKVVDRLNLRAEIYDLEMQIDEPYHAGASVEEIDEFDKLPEEERKIIYKEYEVKIETKVARREECIKELETLDYEIESIIVSQPLEKDEKIYNLQNEIINKEIPEHELIKSSVVGPKGVLSKLNIVNEKAFDRVEKIMIGVNNIRLKIRPVRGNFDFKHLSDINKAQFGNIYDLPRADKGIIQECKDILRDLKSEKFTNTKSIDEFADKTTKHISKISNLNVFEKGNTDTIKEFTRTLGMATGYEIDLSKIDDKAFKLACDIAKEGRFEVLNKMVKESTLNFEPIKDLAKEFEKLIDLER